MENKDSALDKIVEFGSKAVEGAKDLFEKARPVVEEGAQKAMEGARDAYEKIRPKVEEGAQKAVEAVKEAFEQVTGKNDKEEDDAPVSGAEILENAEEASEAVEDKKERPLDAQEEIAAHVDEQVARIRASQFGTDMIHDYFEKKLEEPDTPNE